MSVEGIGLDLSSSAGGASNWRRKKGICDVVFGWILKEGVSDFILDILESGICRDELGFCSTAFRDNFFGEASALYLF